MNEYTALEQVLLIAGFVAIAASLPLLAWAIAALVAKWR